MELSPYLESPEGQQLLISLVSSANICKDALRMKFGMCIEIANFAQRKMFETRNLPSIHRHRRSCPAHDFFFS